MRGVGEVRTKLIDDMNEKGNFQERGGVRAGRALFAIECDKR